MRLLSTLSLTCLATAAQAIGLGAPSGTPTLGRPLRLEIPLIGHAGPPLAADCFQLAPVPGSADELYFPRRARAYIEPSQGKSFVVVAAGDVTQPVVEFRLTVTCGNSLTRDFTLLTMLPLLEAPKTAAQQPPAVIHPPIQPTLAPPPQAPGSPDLLRLTQDTTLEALSREKYPAQPKAREKFKRMMQAANSSQIPSGEGFDLSLIPAGTELSVPKGLPERRYGPYVAPITAAPRPPTSASLAAPTNASPKPIPGPTPAAARKTSAPADRLVLDASAAPPMSAAEASADLARLESIHTEQIKAQEALDERIARAQEAFAEIKEYVLQTEARIRALEERNREQERRAAEAQIWQLATAVLLGGVLGAGLLRAYPLLIARYRNKPDEEPALPVPQPAKVVTPPVPNPVPATFAALRSYGVKPAEPLPEPAMVESPAEATAPKPSRTIEPLDFDFTPSAMPPGVADPSDQKAAKPHTTNA